MDYLTFTINGRTIKVDPDIYYQIFNIRPSRPNIKFVGRITRLRFSNNRYPALVIGKRKTLSLSRFIMKPPRGKVVDHINGDVLDNRRENLRIVNHRQNALNGKPNKKTALFGVCICKRNNRKCYKAQFSDKYGKEHSFYALDCPENRILAAYAHDKFVLQSGDEEYAPLNFDNFKYEPFRTFLLETDLNKYKIKHAKCLGEVQKTKTDRHLEHFF